MPPSDELVSSKSISFFNTSHNISNYILQRALKLQKERLLVDFSNVITNFQSVQGDAARREEAKDEAKSSYFKELQVCYTIYINLEHSQIMFNF